VKRLRLKPYADQRESWPDRGRVLLAQYDDQTVVVYQAYPPPIGHYAARHGHLGGPGFSFDRMSWIQPGFLWTMYRSGWAGKPGQEVVLAIWLQRPAFDAILSQAVHSRYLPQVYESEDAWKRALHESDVRLQWDPDHPPHGPKLRRRAIQLGLGGETLHRYAREWITHVEDITALVHEQARFRRDPDFLLTPAERIYPVKDPAVARRLGLDKSTA
jgi:hypothetical protein